MLTLMSLSCLANYENDNFNSWYYKTKDKYKPWKYIILHHSATDAGSVKSFHKTHTKLGYGGIAYHFVIGNGKGMKDGEVEETFRWKQQMSGTHVTVDSWHYNIFGIGICLVGNMESKAITKKQQVALEKLLKKLQKKYSIPTANIQGHRHVPFDSNKKKRQQTLCPGRKLDIKKIKKSLS